MCLCLQNYKMHFRKLLSFLFLRIYENKNNIKFYINYQLIGIKRLSFDKHAWNAHEWSYHIP